MMYPELAANLEALTDRFDEITPERKALLLRLTDYVRTAERPVRLVAICTHNSRRSHFTQLGLMLAANFYGLIGVETYSGGTETTAFHPLAVAAVRDFGIRVVEEEPGSNPVYRLRTGPDAAAYRAFSKVYDAPPNPTTGFAAIMVCSEADAGCPVVPGCELRLPLPYDDPKVADGTDREAATYDARLREICRDMLYALGQV